VPPVMSAASVFLLVVGTGRSTLLRSGSEAAMVPAEDGCGVASGGGSAVRSAIPGAAAGISGAGTRVPRAEGRRSCSVLSASTWQERSSISCRSAVLGGGLTLASASWGATSQMRSAQRAAASELHSCWPVRMACMLEGCRLDQMV
jgi:hypothetical protein